MTNQDRAALAAWDRAVAAYRELMAGRDRDDYRSLAQAVFLADNMLARFPYYFVAAPYDSTPAAIAHGR